MTIHKSGEDYLELILILSQLLKKPTQKEGTEMWERI